MGPAGQAAVEAVGKAMAQQARATQVVAEPPKPPEPPPTIFIRTVRGTREGGVVDSGPQHASRPLRVLGSQSPKG